MDAELFIPILAIGGFFTMIIMLRNFTNKERMAMIDKGADPSIFKSTVQSYVLIVAGLLIGAGLGLLVASFLENTLNMEEVVYPACLFVFGGLGLIAGRKMTQKEENS